MVTNQDQTQSTELARELSERYSLPVTSIHAPFLLAAKKVWGEHRSKIDKSIEMAQALGSQVVVVHLPYFWQLDYARWSRDNLNDYARGTGITLAVENAILVKFFRLWNFSFFNSLQELKLFDHLVFDTSHFAIAGVDILKAWKELRARVCHIHLSNNYLMGFDDHALPFDGRLPLDRLLRLLNRDGYNKNIVLELGPGSLETRLGERRILKNLRRSLQYCMRYYGNPDQ
jgi:sugar phosphate isomerase/epimerase